jgi:PTS system cellobiose-specific IIB component
MHNIVIVCGAGASSTFLASRMRALAKARGLSLGIEAASDDDITDRLTRADVLLVGPHLEAAFDTLQRQSVELGVLAVLLPADSFGPTGAERAHDSTLELLAELKPMTEGSPRG